MFWLLLVYLGQFVSTYMSCGRDSIVKSYKFTKAIELNIILLFVGTLTKLLVFNQVGMLFYVMNILILCGGGIVLILLNFNSFSFYIIGLVLAVGTLWCKTFLVFILSIINDNFACVNVYMMVLLLIVIYLQACFILFILLFVW